MKNYKFNNLIISLNKLRLLSTLNIHGKQAVAPLNIEPVNSYITNINNNDSQQISPWFITGFTDAEGSLWYI